jgi:hypothetical protein
MYTLPAKRRTAGNTYRQFSAEKGYAEFSGSFMKGGAAAAVK